MQSGVAVPAWGLLCVVFIGLVILASIGGGLALLTGSGRERHGTLRVLGLALALGIGLPVLAFGLLAGFWVTARSPMPQPPVEIQGHFRPMVETNDFGQAESDPWRAVAPDAFSGSSATPHEAGIVDKNVVTPQLTTPDEGPVSALTAIQPLAPREPATITGLTQEENPEKQVAIATARRSSPSTTTVARPAEAPPVPTDDRTVRSSVSLPTWAVIQADQRVIPGEPFRQVVASQLFATESEARQDARRQVIEQVILDMRHGGWLRSPPSATFQPSQHTVDSVITQTHVETVSRDFGSFFAPMFRVWHQVEIGPSSRSMLLSELRVDQSESRNLVVLVAVGLIFCLPLAIVFQGWLSRRIPFGGRWLGIGAILILALFLIRWTRAQSPSTATISSSPPVTISIESPR